MPGGKRRSKRLAAQSTKAKKLKTVPEDVHPSDSESDGDNRAGIQNVDEEVSFTFTNAQLEKLLNQAADKALQRAGVQPNKQSKHQAVDKPSTSSAEMDTQDSHKDLSDIIMEEGESKIQLQVTGGVPLDLHVSKKLREKILAEEFIELGELLERDPEKLETFNFTMTKSKFIAKPRSTQIRNFRDWDNAWDIFMCVYGRKEENTPKMPALVKHRSHVKELHDRHGRWQFYDRQFRQLKALLGDGLSWETLHTEIFMKAMLPDQHSGEDNAKVIPSKAASPKSSDDLPLGHCWNAIKGLPCKREPCKLKHPCKKCNRAHKLQDQCNFRGSTKQDKQHKPSSTAQSGGQSK